MEQPIYIHDCTNCTFLGGDTDANGDTVDMYFCPQGGLPTIIMRYSDDGSDYASAPVSVINDNLDAFQHSPLLRNMLIAEDMVLWNREVV